MADAAAWGALISILMKLYPKNVTTIAAWTEMLVGFGYMIGIWGYPLIMSLNLGQYLTPFDPSSRFFFANAYCSVHHNFSAKAYPNEVTKSLTHS